MELILNLEENKPEIEYPCNWEYKVIGNDVDKLLTAVENAAGGLNYSVKPSNVSRNNKYFSINVIVEVPNEVTRDIIYKSLVKSENVKMVL
jgi:uncharacterized protein